MKFLVTFVALIAAVASASIKTTEMDQIIAAINSPSTDPATAAALEQMLVDLIGQEGGIVVGPAIIEPQPIPSPVTIVDEAEHSEIMPSPVQVVDDASPINPSPINPSPVVVGPIPAGSTPLVQIILNINSASDVEVSPAPVDVPAIHPVAIVDEAEIIDPVQIVDVMPVVDPVQIIDVMPVVDPVQIIDVMPVVDPIQIVDVAPVIDPIQIVDVAPVIDPIQIVDMPEVSPIIIGTPILPTPVINIPGIIN